MAFHCNHFSVTSNIPKIVLLPSCHSYCTWLHCAGFLSPSLLITLNIRTWKLVLFISLQCILLVECLYHSIFNSCMLFLIKLLLFNIIDTRFHGAVVAVIVYLLVAISTYHHWCWEFESRTWRDLQHYVIKLSVTCERSVVFSESSGFLHQ